MRRIRWQEDHRQGSGEDSRPSLISPPSENDAFGFSYPSSLFAELELHSRSSTALPSGSFKSWSAAKLKRACRAGLPVDLRPDVWRYLLKTEDAGIELARQGDSYSELLKRKIPAKIGRVIQVDLKRTFPGNLKFAALQTELRDVLFAFAVARPDVGYCQGLNFIAGTFLIVFSADHSIGSLPETAFLALYQFISNRLDISHYFTPGMSLLLSDLSSLYSLVVNHLRLPLHQAIRSPSALTVATSEWFHTCFVTAFPFPIVLRIWDVLIAEGKKGLFRSAVGTLKAVLVHGSEMDEEELLVSHKKLTRAWGDADELLRAGFSESFSRKDLMEERGRNSVNSGTSSAQVFASAAERVGSGSEWVLEDIGT